MGEIDARLREERARVAAQAADLAAEFDAIVAASADVALDDEHDPDGSTVGFERARVAALAERARQRLADLDDAIARSGSGDYGRCERCGGDIGVERLAAIPEATTCAICASAPATNPLRRT